MVEQEAVLTSDTNYPEFGHTSQVKDTVLLKTVLTSDTGWGEGDVPRPPSILTS